MDILLQGILLGGMRGRDLGCTRMQGGQTFGND